MEKTAMFAIRIALMLVLLAAGVALGFSIGQQRGFETGSEWGVVQANVAAREAGSSLSISVDEGPIRVVVRQSRGLYKWAKQQADIYDDRKMAPRADVTSITVKKEAAQKTVHLAGSLSLTPVP